MDDHGKLRRGWTTGACAAAAAKAAFAALRGHGFPDPVAIALPGGARAAFALAETALFEGRAIAAVVKDAGDDPDVTHGALIRATVSAAPAGSGVVFRAGPGVGTVTRPGLKLPPGEPAINPVPRQMIRAALAEIAGGEADAVVEIAIPGGERLAERTLNARLGVLGGLSILGTTGVVVPYSCAAWIDSIHRGIDVARAAGIAHVAGATGRTSEAAVRAYHGLPEIALIEMGDFAGGMLKYLRRHPVPRVSIAGGVAKMTKLAQGRLDLHSRRGAVDMAALAELAGDARLAACASVAEAFALASGPAGPPDVSLSAGAAAGRGFGVPADAGDRSAIGAGPAFGAGFPPGDPSALGHRSAVDDRSPRGDRSALGDGPPLDHRSTLGDRSALGDPSAVGDPSEVGDRSMPGDRSALGERSPLGDPPAVGDRSEVGDRSMPGDRSALGAWSPLAGSSSLGDRIAAAAWRTAAAVLAGSAVALEILVVDRDGALVGHAPFHDVPPLNRRT